MMQNRREFLKNTGALALGGLMLPNLADAFIDPKKVKNFGVQLFTTMSVIDKDVEGTLKQIADIGYKEIESAFSMKGGFYGMKPKEFAKLVSDLGMSWQAHHVNGAPFNRPAPRPSADGSPSPARPAMPPMKNLLNNTQEIVDEVAEGGAKYLVCASIPVNKMEEIKLSLEILQKAGEAAKKAGLTFVFHNHTAEFETIEGQRPFDMMASQISADLLKFELDLAWATKAGVNIPELFQKHPGRFPLFHIKDLNKETQRPVEVGTGYIDFKPIFAAAKTAGVKHYFVEQDGAPSPVNNLTTSFNNLKKIVA
ncbi:sugar phosphate isomerase/epimerase [Emticicia sp. W12TSBA100-4]|uniref:sugar phosphate isomerase/epimerase family protein n=1 Tax=Emticicia sp. W12TSBA100-4 TaxID=3160965 RepID=UPI00330605AE